MRLDTLAELDEHQEALRAQITGERGGVHGPFLVLLRSPGLGEHLERLSTHCLHRSGLPPRLAELALLVTARCTRSQHSWMAHLGKAVAAGVDEGALARLASGEDPGFTRRDEILVHRVIVQALEQSFVDDDTYAAARDEFGEQGLVELVGAAGTFATLALLLNVFQVDLPTDREAPFPDVTGFARSVAPRTAATGPER